MNNKSIDKRMNKEHFVIYSNEVGCELQREQDLRFFEIENIIMERIQRLKEERQRKQRLSFSIMGMLIILFLLLELLL